MYRCTVTVLNIDGAVNLQHENVSFYFVYIARGVMFELLSCGLCAFDRMTDATLMFRNDFVINSYFSDV